MERTPEEIARRRKFIAHHTHFLTQEIERLTAERQLLFDEDEELWECQNG